MNRLIKLIIIKAVRSLQKQPPITWPVSKCAGKIYNANHQNEIWMSIPMYIYKSLYIYIILPDLTDLSHLNYYNKSRRYYKTSYNKIELIIQHLTIFQYHNYLTCYSILTSKIINIPKQSKPSELCKECI